MRVDKTNYYLNIAETVAQRSTCIKTWYGCVAVLGDRIVSTGYNGSARGDKNCCDLGICKRKEMKIPSGERYELCLAGNTVVKLLDGTYETIESLSKRNATEFWVYAIDTKTGEIVPALAYNARQTGVRNDIYEIVLDNDTTVKCTGNHKVLLRDCTFKEAQDLNIGESLMPMYYNFARNKYYESISNTVNARKEKMKPYWKCKTKQIATHQLVYKFFNPEGFDSKTELIHHKDDVHINNTPKNLVKLNRNLHTMHHLIDQKRLNDIGKYAEQGRNLFINNLKNNPEKLKKRQQLGRINMTANWGNDEFRKNMLEIQKSNGSIQVQKLNKDPESIKNRGKSKVIKGISLLQFKIKPSELTSENYEDMRINNKVSSKEKSVQIPKIKTILKYFDTLDEAIEIAKTYNHKVVEIRKLNVEIPVYDLTVPEYENFAIDLGDNSCIFVHNCKSIHAEQNCIINAKTDLTGATFYLVGIDRDTQTIKADGECCMLCKRFIKNAGVEKVIIRRSSTEYEVQYVKDWIEE